jgi:hypothetical protein
MGWLPVVLMAMIVLGAAGWWLGNREAPLAALQTRQAHLDKGIQWVLANEDRLSVDANMPLWQMLQEAARIAHRDDLMAMVNRAVTRIEASEEGRSPWLRFVKPDAEVSLQGFDVEGIEAYQQAFLSALTCGAYDQLKQLPEGWRQVHQCRPNAVKVYWEDGACSTHQLMALMTLKRRQCQGMSWNPALVPALQQDIRSQLSWDPIVRDRYVQRVLMLWWTSGEGAVSPLWLQRVMAAQHDDGRWLWAPQVPELPRPLQPVAVWEAAARRWPQWIPPRVGAGDFHATAQGVLLMALAGQSAQSGRHVAEQASLSAPP